MSLGTGAIKGWWRPSENTRHSRDVPRQPSEWETALQAATNQQSHSKGRLLEKLTWPDAYHEPLPMRGGKGLALGKNGCHHCRSSETPTQSADCSPEEESHQARTRRHALQSRYAMPTRNWAINAKSIHYAINTKAIGHSVNAKAIRYEIHWATDAAISSTTRATTTRRASDAKASTNPPCNPSKRNELCNQPSNQRKKGALANPCHCNQMCKQCKCVYNPVMQSLHEKLPQQSVQMQPTPRQSDKQAMNLREAGPCGQLQSATQAKH